MTVPTHRARHRSAGKAPGKAVDKDTAVDPDKTVGKNTAVDLDKTTVLPKIVADPDADRTTVLPVINVAANPAMQPSPAVQANSGAGADPSAERTTVLPILTPGSAQLGDHAIQTPEPEPEPADNHAPAPAPARRRGVGDAVRLVSRSAGELLLTFGLVVLLLAAYELWGKSALINAHQNDLDNQLAQQWGNPAVGASPNVPAGPPPPGGTIGRLYIPKLKLHWVVVEGVELSDIRYAPGHYPGTAMPGQVGNFSVAGHREPGIFWDMDRVQAGDDVVVETSTNWYVYQVFQNHIVSPSSVEVVAPVPNEPGVAATQPDLTLTTCNPRWDNYQRMAVHAKLVATYPHSQRPGELGGS